MAATFGLAHLLSQGGPLTFSTMLTVALANAAMIAGLEQLTPRKPDVNLFRDPQSLNSAAFAFFNGFVLDPASVGLSTVIILSVQAQWSGVASIWPSDLPFLVQLPLVLLLFDLSNYLFHRLLHRFDRLFAFHALHHDTEQFHMLGAMRIHTAEQFVQFLAVATPFILIGVPAELLLWLKIWNMSESSLAHSNVDQRFPSWMHYLIRTVQVHYIHHADRDDLQRSNLGGLPIWDIVFGTFRHPEHFPVHATGIGAKPVPRGLLAQLVYPIRAQFGSAKADPRA